MKRAFQIKKAAIVIPPFADFYATPHRLSTLGAGILSRLLERNEIDVHFFNFPLEGSRRSTLPLPDTLHYLTPHILPNERGRFSFFTQYHLFGPSFQECVQRIISDTPDIIFISCFAYCYADAAIAMCNALKQMHPEVLIIAGGSGAAVHPAYFVSSPGIDFVMTGEAELCVTPLLNYLRGTTGAITEIPGLITKESKITGISQRVFTDSTTLEPGYRSSLHDNRLRIDLTITRGCPLDCAFCSNRLCHGTLFRRVSLDQIRTLIAEIAGSLHYEPTSVEVNFEDDNLLIDSSFWFQVLALIKGRFPQTHFFAENGLDYRLLTESSSVGLIELGMKQFNLALGSINQEASSHLSRSSSLDHYDRLLSIFARYAVPVITYFIAGFHGDSRERIAENLLFLLKRTTLIGFSMFYPVPGLPGFTDLTMFKPGESVRCCGSSAYPWNKSVDTAMLVTAFRLSRFINMTKSTEQNELEKELISRSLKTRRLHTIVRLKKVKTIIEVPHQDMKLATMVLGSMVL